MLLNISIDVLRFSSIQSSSFLKKFVSFIPSIHMVALMLDGTGSWVRVYSPPTLTFVYVLSR
jgi:hypothetical protein